MMFSDTRRVTPAGDAHEEFQKLREGKQAACMIRHSIWKPFVAFASLLALLAAHVMPGKTLAAAPNEEIVIVALGDSLTAGYQLPPSAAFPVQLENALRARGANVKVINAGVSGDTSADGLARLDWSMPDDADAVILELGANDALRGHPVAAAKQSLDAIMAKLQARKLPVLIAGMEAPRNWGADYQTAFRQIYPDLAEKYGALLYPFFLDGVAMDRSLSLPDGLHPTAKGVERIVERILPSVEQLIQRVEKKRSEPS
jgi:acyl-CoA thioesterase-1